MDAYHRNNAETWMAGGIAVWFLLLLGIALFALRSPGAEGAFEAFCDHWGHAAAVAVQAIARF